MALLSTCTHGIIWHKEQRGEVAKMGLYPHMQNTHTYRGIIYFVGNSMKLGLVVVSNEIN